MTARTPRSQNKNATAKADSQIAWLIWEAFQQTRRSIEKVVRGQGVTAPQLGILNRLADQPGLSGVEVARALLVSAQAAQVALETLERKGLIERKSAPEGGRALQSFLTEEGRRVVDGWRSQRRRVGKQLVAGISPADRVALVELLERYIESVSRQAD